MNLECLTKQVLNLRSLKKEGNYWDFKREWPQNKSDLLHDIICMANSIVNKDRLIIIGVDEESDYSISGISNGSNRRKTQDIVTFLRDKNFAGGIRPTVDIQTLAIEGKEVDVIVIQNDRNTPYYLTASYKGLFANHIYSRIMDTNTPKNSSADINVVEQLWRKRFGIDAPVMEQATLYLQNPESWESPSDTAKKFYKYAPEFVIEHIPADRNGYEFYLFGQTDHRPHWYDINIYCHQTLLDSLGGVALGGGRYFTSTPQTDGLSLSDDRLTWNVSYKYFIKGAIDYIVHRFYITDDMDEELSSRRRFLECVLIFESEFEKDAFDIFVSKNYKTYEASASECMLPHFPEIEGYVMSEFKKDYVAALLLKRMLNDFRAQEVQK